MLTGTLSVESLTTCKCDLMCHRLEQRHSVAFGPDICGTQTRHTKLTVKTIDAQGNHFYCTMASRVRCETDELTHVYTLVMRNDGFEIFIDGRRKAHGSWDFANPDAWTVLGR